MAPGLEMKAAFEDVRQPPGEPQQAPLAVELTTPLGLVNIPTSGELQKARERSPHKQMSPAAARCLPSHQPSI